MADRIEYDVVAWLRMRGDFARQMKRQAAAAGNMSRKLGEVGRKMQAMGGAWMRSVTTQIAAWGRLAAAITAAMGAAAGAAVLANGLKFNKTMEDARNQIAAMYQMFDFMGDSTAVASGRITQWEANIGLAKHAMSELYGIARQSPATFAQVASLYQNSAAGLATQTEDVTRHLEFMKRASLLGGLTGGDYDVLGSQVGRIISGSAGAEMNIWKTLQKPISEAGKRMGVFQKTLPAVGMEVTQAFNSLGGDKRLMVMMEAMKKIGPEVAATFATSMAGISSTAQSALETVSGRLAKPLYETWRKALIGATGENGILGERSIAKFEKAADYFGGAIARGATHLIFRITTVLQLIRDNWQRIADTTYKAFQVGAGMIRGAFAYGLTKMIAGAALTAGGGALRAAGAARTYGGKVAGFMGAQRKVAHARIVRGAHGKAGGILGRMGKMMGAKSSGVNDVFRNIAVMLARFGSLAAVMAGVIPMIAMLGMALGAVGVAVAGVAAYIVSNWAQIRDSMVGALKSGTVTLRPLVAAAYVFWGRLKAVGEAFLGGTSGAHMLGGMIELMAKATMMGANAISFFMKVIAIFIGVWGSLKLALQGVMFAILGIIKLANKIPGGPSDETLARAQKNYDAYRNSTLDTFTTVDNLLRKADELDKVNLDSLDFGEVERKSKEFEQGLAGFLSKLGAKDSPTGGKQPVVKVNKVELNWDLRGEDPDRLLTAFVEPLERLADNRVQAYDTIDQGS